MKLLFISDYFSPAIMQAICRTLLHSLWQGLLAASLAGIIILFTKRSKATIRYNLLSFVFICFIVCAAITFLKQPGILHPVNNGSVIRVSSSVNKSFTVSVNNTRWLPAFEKEKYYQPVIYYADKYAGLITGLWLLFFLIHILRMIAGLHYVHRIRYSQVTEPTEKWKQRIAEMSKLLGIRKTISLMESGLVKVPVVVGALKPVILVPMGMISNLSTDQVEAVLLHELAHVRRKDFVINLLQRVAEAFFFFNPFIVWVSARIREEREACCDDIVIEHTTDKRSYLEALVSFREPAAAGYSHAMALGRNNNLLHRVKRMITQENKKLNAMEKLTLIFVLMAFCALSFMPAGKVAAKKNADTNRQVILLPREKKKDIPAAKNNNKVHVSGHNQNTDTLPAGKPISFNNISSNTNDDGTIRKKEVTARSTDGKTYSYRMENDKIVEMTINGEKIKEENFYRYNGIIDQIESAWKENERKSLEDQKLNTKELLEKRELLNEQLMDLQNKQSLMKQNELEKLIKEQKLTSNSDMALSLQQNKLQLAKENNSKLLQLQSENLALLNEKLSLDDKNHLELIEKLNDKNELLNKDQFELRNKLQLLSEQDEKFNVSNAELANIIYELSKAGVLKDEKNFSFTLNDDELIVDGKKQATDLYESLRKKHIRNKKDHFTYKVKENSRSTDIYVE